MKRIVCFHLFNDYSGSPKVLKMTLEELLKRGWKVDLVSSRNGVLDELKGHANLRFFSYYYHFSTCHALTMLRYVAIQVYTFFWAFRYLFRRDVLFYVNTLLPAGPALAGWLMRKPVLYHYHENAFQKGFFYRMLCKWMETFATEIICVSTYQASFLKRKDKVTVVSNTVPADFVERLRPIPEEAFHRKRVLMLGSLKAYKGTLEFSELAKRLPQFQFEQVVSDTPENLNDFVERHTIDADNLTLFPRQNDVVPFYNRASLVLNLSNKELVIETFGLTALEAMSAGLPVIVPTVGGIAEMVTDGANGYKIDVQDLDQIANKITTLLTDRELYLHIAYTALEYSKKFSTVQMLDSIDNIVGNFSK